MSLFYRQPKRTKCREGLIVCKRCEGYGAIDVGAGLPLSCHRCWDGLTTKTFQAVAAAWEMNCYAKISTEFREQLLRTLNKERVARELLLMPRWYEKLQA